MQQLPWAQIDTVLLDMDGTLLDLHFDNHFWLNYLPQCYADKNGLSRAAADAYLQPLFASYTGQLNWYCVEFWSKTLDLPIKQMKRDTAHLIDLRANADGFLAALQQAGKHSVLVTTAHRFWSSLSEQIDYQPERSLFIDDSLPVLRSAQRYGIGHLRAVLQPDSLGPDKSCEEFIPSTDLLSLVSNL